MPRSVFTDDYARLLAVLVAARTDAAVTQAELARRLDRPQSYVSKIERGERRVDLVEFVGLSRALGIDPRKLFDTVLAGI
ncbi:MAG: helix-turn-helix domain-containing protein [Caulobacter sp.]|nr:helix-turn-helix domain-containing protein [Caulobacter sp.]